MGHPTFGELLNMLVTIRDRRDYRDDPERDEARFNAMESIMQSMLEKLRDELDPQ